MNIRLASLTTLAASAVLLAGCSNPAAPAKAPDVPTSTSTLAAPVTTPASPAGDDQTPVSQPSQASAGSRTRASDPQAHNESASAAIRAAESELTGRAIALDADGDGDDHWELDVVVGDRVPEVEVDRAGKVVNRDDQDALDADDRRKLDAAKVTIQQAIDAALAKQPGHLDDIELDDADGRVVWEVTIDSAEAEDVEVEVDAANGTIVKVDS